MRRLLAGLALLAGLCAAGIAQAGCSADRVEIRGAFGVVAFDVERADTPAARARGLMHRRHLPRWSGMLFIFPDERPVAFWMRNTLIPLDMLFVDARGVIRHIHPNAQPLDETPISSGVPVRFVLEINGGLSERLGIAPGDVLHHPAIPADIAAWPCAAPASE